MINYGILADSVSFYRSEGFERIEVPWMVSEYVDNLTKPPHAKSFVIEENGKHLVASAEQSFLELYLKKYLPNGRFQAITPCFRYEKRDGMHCKTFMKNELIITDKVTRNELDRLIKTAHSFFKSYLPECQIIKTDSGFDIEIDGNELGSYGIREFDHIKYIYGTGVAEPRLSRLINKYGVSY